MAKIFLDQLTRMVDRATSGPIGRVTVECKHFFSGAAVYAGGRICASLTPAGFAIKLPKESRDILLKRRGVKPLRYFAGGPVKKEYVVLPKALIDDPNSLRELLEISAAYVRRSSKAACGCSFTATFAGAPASASLWISSPPSSLGSGT